MTKNAIRKKIAKIRAVILLSESKIKELEREYLLKCNYTEQEETHGRGKTRETALIGRIHWHEYFSDEDTGQRVRIDRSRAVKKNGEWLPGY